MLFNDQDDGDKYYIIVDGTASVTKWNEATQENVELITLTIGNGFGEMALIRKDGKRTATVTASSKMMTFSLDRKLFRSLISDRSWSVIQYELAKFDKSNLKKLNQLKKYQELESKSQNEQLELLRLELNESSTSNKEKEWQQKSKERNQHEKAKKRARKESISIVIGALDDAISSRSKTMQYRNKSVSIVNQCLQEAFLMVAGKLGQDTADTNNDPQSMMPYAMHFENGWNENQKQNEELIEKMDDVDDYESKERYRNMYDADDLEDTTAVQAMTSWSVALETGRNSMSSELLEQIDTMSEISFGSYGTFKN